MNYFIWITFAVVVLIRFGYLLGQLASVKLMRKDSDAAYAEGLERGKHEGWRKHFYAGWTYAKNGAQPRHGFPIGKAVFPLRKKEHAREGSVAP